jgi:polyhydroxybutyrate depolymerase
MIGKIAIYLAIIVLAMANTSWADSLGFEIGGLRRKALVHIPKKRPDDPPLVIMLHAGGGSAKSFERWTGFDETAENGGAIVVYPDGIGRTWNAGTCCGIPYRTHVDDVGFIRSLVDRIHEKYGVDRKRVYIAGMSNGGMMAYRVAAEAPEMVAAAAIVEGTMVIDKLPRGNPVPLMIIHSADDQRVPFDGGTRKGHYFPPVSKVIKEWMGRNGCKDAPVEDPERSWKSPGGSPHYARRKVYGNCSGHSEIELWVTRGPGHVWPGAKGKEPTEKLLGAASNVIDANQLIMDFFERHANVP